MLIADEADDGAHEHDHDGFDHGGDAFDDGLELARRRNSETSSRTSPSLPDSSPAPIICHDGAGEQGAFVEGALRCFLPCLTAV